MAGGEHGIAKSGGLGGAQPHVWIVLVRIELLSQRPVVARSGGRLPLMSGNDSLGLFRSELRARELAPGDHGPRNAVFGLDRRNAPVNKQAQAGVGIPLRVKMSCAMKRGWRFFFFDSDGGVLVADRGV